MEPTGASHPSSPDLYSASESGDSPILTLPTGQSRTNSTNGDHSQSCFGSVSANRQSPDSLLNLDLSFAEKPGDSAMNTSCDTSNPENLWVGPPKRKQELDLDLLSLPSRSVRSARPEAPTGSILVKTLRNTSGEPKLNGASQEVKYAESNGHYTGLGLQDSQYEGDLTSYVKLSVLSNEIWQHIFCFVPPVFLGRLLRVNRTFNELLTFARSSELPNTQSNGVLRLLAPETIWAASRKRFCPGLPRPLEGCNELDMWRLLRGNDCQICGKKKVLLTTFDSTNPWHCGPGQEGVRIIWPFGIRSCGPCMHGRSEKEVNLLFSSTFPSFLLPALPFAFLSQSEHYVSSTALRSMVPPPEVLLTKYFYKPHVEDTKQQLEHAKELGSASAEEWIKGLDDKGKERSSDAARWEQWEAKGGLKKVNIRPNAKGTISSTKYLVKTNTSVVTLDHPSSNKTPLKKGLPNPITKTDVSSVDELKPVQDIRGLITGSRSTITASFDGLPQRPLGTLQQTRPERSIRDVNEAKAARRVDIECRCMALEPPIEPNVLHHMESFQAAIQISTAMTDTAWDVLKPRLLAQREAAQRREDERIQQGKLLQAKSEERRQQEAQLKEAKETLDKEWDATQAPIRHQLAAYADEIIQDSWSGGNTITKDTSPKFAADVLVYVRRRFYDNIAREDAVRRAVGQDINQDVPHGPPSRRLILENMKWLFDNKIKAFTENYQKELFLCNGCDGNFKFYGFEGVIQHYAAKHTTSLSLGSIVVHWRSEWPEHPPFNPNPSVAKTAYYAIPLPLPATLHNQTGPTQTTGIYNGYSQEAVSGPQITPHRFPISHLSSSPYHLQHQNDYRQESYPQVAPQQVNHEDLSGQSSSYQPNSHYHPVPPSENSSGNLINYNGYPESQTAPQQYYNPSLTRHNFLNSTQGQVPAGSLSSFNQGLTYPHVYSSDLSQTSLPPFSTHVDLDNNFPGQGVDLYQTQMSDMAKHARDVWFGTSGIKDIPQSVRIFVVIHHVVFRFYQKYTNEPNLAMFIDGLNQNALMRPVRSLNGLACRTCVVHANRVDLGSNIPPQTSIGDRKLYTLPHLFNHFKTEHVERAGLAMMNSAGLEPWRPDWKRDMVELPEPPLIADLINAPGMDDAKLQLIAWVFPGVFPSPLPKIGSGGNSGPVPKYKGDHATISAPLKHKRDLTTGVSRIEPDFLEDRSDGLPLSRPYSAQQLLSTEHTPEPPGEDEYDPHRPAYLGRIVQANTINIASRKRKLESPIRNEHSSKSIMQRNDRFNITSRPSQSTRNITKTNPNHREYCVNDYTNSSPRKSGSLVNDQLETERYYDFSQHTYPEDALSEFAKARKIDQSKDEATERYVSEDGEVNEGSILMGSERRSPSLGAEPTAAERFLNNFSPKPESGKRSHGLFLINPTRGQQSRRDDPDESHLDRHLHSREEVDLLSQQHDHMNIECTPVAENITDLWQGENSEYVQHSQKPNGYTQPASHHLIKSRIEYLGSRDSVDRNDSPFYASYDFVKQPLPHSFPEEINYDGTRVNHRFAQQHRLNYRERSRSPEVNSLRTHKYRTRSPLGATRQGSVLQPLSTTQNKLTRVEQPVYYDNRLAQDEYSYARSSDYQDRQTHRRIEYIPARPERYEASEHRDRYLVSQSTEHREPIDQTRFARGYIGDHVYEKASHVYYTEPRIYNT